MPDNTFLSGLNGVEIGAQRPVLPALKSSHLLPGQGNWWNPAGIVNGHYVNLEPDDGPILQTDVPGGRGTLYESTPYTNYSVEVVWTGDEAYGQAGPIACIDVDDDMFGLSFYREPVLNSWILWELGRRPDQLNSYVSVLQSEPHVNGTPITLRMDIRDNHCYCFADGVAILDAAVPVNLQGSGVAGVSVDVNNAPGRPANAPVATFPYTVRPL